MPTPAERHFLGLGIEYYVCARSAAITGQSTVCGNLFHHAIEMLIKARLCQRYSLQELSHKPFRHKLPELWRAFKSDFLGAGLEKFDTTITTLDQFERLRYPDRIIEEGAQILIAWEPNSLSTDMTKSPPRPEPLYEIVVTDIDRLIAKIFELCSKSLKSCVGLMNSQAREALTCGNPTTFKD